MRSGQLSYAPATTAAVVSGVYTPRLTTFNQSLAGVRISFCRERSCAVPMARRACPERSRGCNHALISEQRHALDFDENAHRQTRDLDRAARRRGIATEEPGVDCVERREIIEVGQEAGGLDREIDR